MTRHGNNVSSNGHTGTFPIGFVSLAIIGNMVALAAAILMIL